jgi:hypothetical protein
MFGRVANLSMVPGQVQGGTRVVPGWQRGARCPSQYCEDLCKPTPSYPEAGHKPSASQGIGTCSLVFLLCCSCSPLVLPLISSEDFSRPRLFTQGYVPPRSLLCRRNHGRGGTRPCQQRSCTGAAQLNSGDGPAEPHRYLDSAGLFGIQKELHFPLNLLPPAATGP